MTHSEVRARILELISEGKTFTEVARILNGLQARLDDVPTRWTRTLVERIANEYASTAPTAVAVEEVLISTDDAIRQIAADLSAIRRDSERTELDLSNSWGVAPTPGMYRKQTLFWVRLGGTVVVAWAIVATAFVIWFGVQWNDVYGDRDSDPSTMPASNDVDDCIARGVLSVDDCESEFG